MFDSLYKLLYINLDETDYILPDGYVAIPLLSSEDICIEIEIIDDELVEDQETFVIEWTLRLNDELLNRVSLRNFETIITIDDNDGKLYQQVM